MSSRRIFSGTPWEKVVGYCRAIERGGVVAVSGTVSAFEGKAFDVGDAGAQKSRCLEIIESALRELGLSRADVIRTRLFVTDISRWEEFGRAHGEFFRGCEPATSMLEVSALISPEYLVEIEADAVRSVR
ncbi:MAG: RidA family protein [Bdellovibrionota bacterium]